MNCLAHSLNSRQLFSLLHILRKRKPQNGTPAAEAVRDIRRELHRRDYSADLEDVLNGGHTFDLDRNDPTWIEVYPLPYSDFPPNKDKDDLKELDRIFWLFYSRSRFAHEYDCSGETFTMDFHLFKRRGEWWVYETLAIDC